MEIASSSALSSTTEQDQNTNLHFHSLHRGPRHDGGGLYHRTIRLDHYYDHQIVERYLQMIFECIRCSFYSVVSFCASFLFVPILEDPWSLIYLSIGLLLVEHIFGSLWLQVLWQELVSPLIFVQAIPISSSSSPVESLKYNTDLGTNYQNYSHTSKDYYYDSSKNNITDDDGMISALLGLFGVLSLLLSCIVNLSPSTSSWWARRYNNFDSTTAIMGFTLVGMFCLDAILFLIVVFWGYRHVSSYSTGMTTSIILDQLFEQEQSGQQHQHTIVGDGNIVESILNDNADFNNSDINVVDNTRHGHQYHYFSNFLFLLIGFWFGNLLRSHLLRREIYGSMG